MHFGFSYIGLLYLVLLFVPNLIWIRHKPAGYERYAKTENKVLAALEQAGEILVCCTVLIFSDFNLSSWSPWCWWLMASLLLMLLYEVYWVWYFCSEKRMEDFYRNLLGIPVAGATLPVAAILLLAVYGKNPLLGGATVILGIGHIGIHLIHARKIGKE